MGRRPTFSAYIVRSFSGARIGIMDTIVTISPSFARSHPVNNASGAGNCKVSYEPCITVIRRCKVTYDGDSRVTTQAPRIQEVNSI